MTRVRLLVFNPALPVLDYRLPKGMTVEFGQLVIAPLGPRQVLGIVWEPERLGGDEVPESKLRQILEVLPVAPLSAPLRRSSSQPSAEKRAALSAMAYEAAEALWNPLAAACDAEGRIPDTAASRALKARHYSDGTPVLKDLRLVGWRFVRELLGELGRADAMAFREQGYDRWSEKYQSSPQNDAYLLRAVMMVLERHRVPPR